MSRGFSDCCHYDDGYDDGFADGKQEAPEAPVALAESLRWLSRYYSDRFDPDALEAIATELERDLSVSAALTHYFERAPQRALALAERMKAAA